MKSVIRKIMPVLILVFCLSGVLSGLDSIVLSPEEWRLYPACEQDKGEDIPQTGEEWPLIRIYSKGNVYLPNVKSGQKMSAKVAEAFRNRDLMSLWMRQTISCPEDWAGKRVFINFPHVLGDCKVYMNGTPVGEVHTPTGELELTGTVKGGENELIVFTFRKREHPDPFTRAFLKHMGYEKTPWKLTWGFLGNITLKAKSSAYLSDVFARTSWRNKRIDFDLEVDSQDQKALSAEIRVLDADGKCVKNLTADFDAVKGRKIITAGEAWTGFRTWELDAPYLYRAEVCLKDKQGNVLDSSSFRFGFREAWREGKILYLNGHPMRIRLVYPMGGSAASISFFRLMGYNFTMYPHSCEILTPLDEALLDKMDETGTGYIAPLPYLGFIRMGIMDDPEVAPLYRKYAEIQARRYRNHPCIIQWSTGFFYCPSRNIAPQHAGMPEADSNSKLIRAINMGCDLAREYVPGTHVFSRQDGSTGDVSGANVYLNFTPLQEREDWLSNWAVHGVLPYSAGEFGMPYTACFYKGNNLFLSEYAAIYFGYDAYNRESDKGLSELVNWSISRGAHEGALRPTDLSKKAPDLEKDYPVYWDLYALFMKNTNRAWRTWGINAGMPYFNLQVAYGTPPGTRGSIYNRYAGIAKEITEKPDWANPAFDIHKVGNMPFLGYIGGSPVHTDKTHAFYSREKVMKNLVIVYDGYPGKEIMVKYQVIGADDKILKEDTVKTSVTTGSTTFLPVEFTAPAVEKRTQLRICADFLDRKTGESLARDEFPFEVYPTVSGKIWKESCIILFDPVGTTAEYFKKAGIPYTVFKAKEQLKSDTILVVGEFTLKQKELPFRAEDLKKGLKVLVMQQSPESWQALGFQPMDTMSRQMYLSRAGHSVLAGVDDRMLSHWRGEPGFNEKNCGPLMEHDTQRGSRWTHTHAIAPLTLKIPEKCGFASLISGEFDMNYSALLRFTYGQGTVCFCTLAWKNRLGIDPMADHILSAILKGMGKDRTAAGLKVYTGKDPDVARLMTDIGIEAASGALPQKNEKALLIIGEKDSIAWDRITQLADSGVKVFVMQNNKLLSDAGLPTVKEDLYRIRHAHYDGNLMRWRDKIECNAIAAPASADPVEKYIRTLLFRNGGSVTFMQLPSYQLINRYKNDDPKRSATFISTERLLQLYAQLLTDLGASPAKQIADRTVTKAGIAQFAPVRFFYLLGPYHAKTDTAKDLHAKIFEGEQSAVEGEFLNPNIVFTLPNGKQTDWRTTAQTEKDGRIDLAAVYSGEKGFVTYMAFGYKRKQAGTVLIRFTSDAPFTMWCNGKEVFRYSLPGSVIPFEFKSDMKAGENAVAIKVSSFRKPAVIKLEIEAERENISPEAAEAVADTSLYVNLLKVDPYMYTYW